MKKIISIFAITALLVTGTAFTYAQKHVETKKFTTGEWFDVRFENDCSSDVKRRIEDSGSASEGTLYKKSTQSHSLRKGYKVYVDGKLFLEAAESDGGKTYVVCK